MRATVQEIYHGLQARAQNAWPSLRFDVMALNDLAAPFLGAGFYYKTFMWPKSFWEKVYEPLIRRAAGLGALGGQAVAEPYEKAYAFCDLLIIGSGPAGLMAALTAARAGADVILADEDFRMGGSLLSETGEIDGQPCPDWVQAALEDLAALPNVRLMSRTTVTGAYDGHSYGALERVSQHVRAPAKSPRETFWRIVAPRAILATGASERPIAFPNNDRPGIMTASALRAYAHRFGVVPGRAVTVFTNNDSGHRVAADLLAIGVNVAAVIDPREDAQALGDYTLKAGALIIGTSGRLGLESITVQSGSGTHRVFTDCLAVSGGWNPNLHLTCHMNGRPNWDESLAAFVPQPGAIPGLIAAGAANGAFSTAACLRAGQSAAMQALDLTTKDPLPSAEDAPYSLQPLWAVPGKGRAWLDFQNDVTVKDVRQAAQENFRSVEHMKRYTTQGMATDQGKASNVQALAILADATGRGIPETGTTTFRPPYIPVAIAALGAGAQGKGFAPERRTTSDTPSRAMGAPMIEAGLWYRPSYFPRAGETTWRDACDREVGYVREAVGVADVSTLGKIDIQGPDAGAFLDFVYANTFSTLKAGRVRYGIMLREDGFVMDDGTTACLADNHYLMTTTTVAAGPVMRHLDFVAQVLRPDLDVRFASVTEHWAQFAVAGPMARDLLSQIVGDLSDWPFMSCGTVQIGNVTGRLFRISFSGELGYEIAVPSRYGAALFKALVERAEAMGGGAYGMEALNVLRIEKGFVTHAEIDGRMTAQDVGLGRMLSQKKDFVGRVMAQRPGLTDAARPRLVGLRSVAPDQALVAGGMLFNAGDETTSFLEQGHVSSVGYSPSQGRWIALAFLKNAETRMGETLQFVDHMRGKRCMVEVCDPVFLDKDGGRARA